MKKTHEDLLKQITSGEKLAVEIENEGGNAQAIIHHLRAARQLTELRLNAYKDAEAEAKAKADAEAKAKADAEAKAKADAEAKAKADAEAKANK